MSNYCVSCGTSIPEKQRVCSVCYGNPFYGSDGILLRMMEDDRRRQEYEEWLRQQEEWTGEGEADAAE